jgi:histidinol-phosphatase
MVRGTVSRVARYDDDLRFAHVLADNADDITTRRFRALDLRVDTKPDLTPVSDADHAAEDSLRNVLRRSRPRDAVLGEESGRTGSGQRCWVIDPIDGTKNYVRGVPVWATLIGLMDGPDVVVGVVSAPALSRRWWAALGGGAWTGRSLTKASPLRVSGVTKLGDASMSYSSLGGWEERGLLDNFLGLTQSVWRTRPRSRSSSPRPAAGSPRSKVRPRRAAAARCAPTAICTTRCWPGCAILTGEEPVRLSNLRGCSREFLHRCWWDVTSAQAPEPRSVTP